MGCGDGIASRLKRLSVHPTAQSGVHAAPSQPGAVRHMRCQLARAASIKRWQVSHKLESEASHGALELSTLLPSHACGSRLFAARFAAAVARYTLQWFEDPVVERNYRHFAYVPRVKRLACLLA